MWVEDVMNFFYIFGESLRGSARGLNVSFNTPVGFRRWPVGELCQLDISSVILDHNEDRSRRQGCIPTSEIPMIAFLSVS